MFNDLNAAFPNFTHFYTVNGLSMADALDRCARLTGDDGNVFHYQNQIVFALTHSLGTDIPWLSAVPGTPEEVLVIETIPEEVVAPEPKSK